MFQIVGKIVHNNRIVGLMAYNFASKQLLRANLKDCIDEVSRNNITNLSYENNQLNVTDGSISKLPVYDINGIVSAESLPVILERVTNNGITVGYTFIENGVYNKAKTADLIKTYREFYNAKVVTKDGTTFLSAKRGTFKELELNSGGKQVKVVRHKSDKELIAEQLENIDKIISFSNDSPSDMAEFVYNEEDWVVDAQGVLSGYIGTATKVIMPKNIKIDSHVLEQGGVSIHLDSIILPSTVTFADLHELEILIAEGDILVKHIYLSDSHKEYIIKDNIVFTKDCKTLVIVLKSVDNYVVPDCVEHIEEWAFANWYGRGFKNLNIGKASIGWEQDTLSGAVGDLTIPDDFDTEMFPAFGAENCWAVVNTKITNYYVNKTGRTPTIKSVNGSILSADGKKLLKVPLGRECEYQVIDVPNGVEEIIEDAIGYGEWGRYPKPHTATILILPDSIKSIVENGDEYDFPAVGITIDYVVGSRGSYAEKWAKQKGYRFVVVNEEFMTSPPNESDCVYDEENVFDDDGVECIEYYATYETEQGEYVIWTRWDGLKVLHSYHEKNGVKHVDIPYGVEQLSDTSFQGSSIESVTIPNGVTFIRSHAFYSCSALKEVCIPATVVGIEDGAFSCCSDFIIKCHKGSYAEEYAKANNIKYVIV